jgi:hypothetical protein
MKAFTYERARTPAEAAAAVGQDAKRQVHRRRHQPAGPDEAADRDAAPPDRRQRLGWTRSRPRRTAACGSAPWCATPTWPPTSACDATTPCCPRPAGRRLGPAAQQGHHRRQPAAADALPVFLRHQHALQQTPARRGLLGDRRLHRNLAVLGPARPASPPTPATWPWPCGCWTPGRDRAPDGATRAIPIADFPPPAGRHAARRDHVLDARRADHGRDPAQAARRDPRLPQGPRPGVLRLRPDLGGRGLQQGRPGGSPWAASPTSPGGSRPPSSDLPRGAKAVAEPLLAGAKTTSAERLQADPGRAHARRRDSGSSEGLIHEVRHPRHHQSDRPAEGHRQADRPHRRPAEDHRQAPYAYERHDARPTPPTASSSARRSPRAGSPHHRPPPRQGRAGRAGDRHRENAGKLGKGNFNTARLLGGPEMQHYHQAVAVVVAETFEQARAAAALIKVDYAAPRAASIWPPPRTRRSSPRKAIPTPPSATSPAAFAARRSSWTRPTPPRPAHAMMEPHATIAAWTGDKLTCGPPTR